MIIDGIVTVLAAFFSTLIGGMMVLVPPVPGFVVSGFGAASEVWGFLQGFDTWVPVTLAFTVAAGVCAAWVSAMAIGLLRVIVSYLTLGGGAT